MEYYFVDKAERPKTSRSDRAWLDTLCSQPVEEILRKYHVRGETGRPQATMNSSNSTPGQTALFHAWNSNMPQSWKLRHGPGDATVTHLATLGGFGPSREGSNIVTTNHGDVLGLNIWTANTDLIRPVIISCTISELPPKKPRVGSQVGNKKQRRNFRLPRLNNKGEKIMMADNEKTEESYLTSGANETSLLAEVKEDGSTVKP